MGRVRTKTIKRGAKLLLEKYYQKLTNDFHTNKKILSEVGQVPSKRLRNKIAGFTTHLMKRIQKGPVKGISLKVQEEERERRLDWVPTESEIKIDKVEVDERTQEMLRKKFGDAFFDKIANNLSTKNVEPTKTHANKERKRQGRDGGRDGQKPRREGKEGREGREGREGKPEGEGRGEGRGDRGEGRGEGRGERAEGRGDRTEGRTEGRGEGRIEGRGENTESRTEGRGEGRGAGRGEGKGEGRGDRPAREPRGERPKKE